MNSVKIVAIGFLFFSMMFIQISCSKKKNNRNMQMQADSTQMQNQSNRMGRQSNMQNQKTMVKVNQKEPFGQYLTDGNGRSLYLFLKDSSGKSNCYNDCANTWSPLLTSQSNVKAGQGVDSTMLGTTQRRNGDMQITYNNHPLYYFSSDRSAGDVKGQDVKQFGAEWYLVKPNGKKMGDVEEK